MSKRGTARIADIGDFHVPFLQRKPFEWALKEIRAFRPTHVVMGGDLFESVGGTVFDNEYTHDQLDEYKDGADALTAVEQAASDAELIWLLGNHDDNIQSADPRRVKKALRRAVHWSQSRKYGHVFDRWRQIPYEFSAKGAFQLGQVFFYHDFNGNWDTNLIRMNNMIGGHGNRLGVHHHHHHVLQPQQAMRTKKVPLPLWGASPGTLGPLKPGWTKRQDTSHWSHGICLIEAQLGRACQPKRNWECTTLEYGAE